MRLYQFEEALHVWQRGADFAHSHFIAGSCKLLVIDRSFLHGLFAAVFYDRADF